MEILFVPMPAIGHAFPMVPLASALRSAGHHVTFVTGFDGVRVGEAGFPVIDAMPADLSKADGFPEVEQKNPQLFESMAHLSDQEILDLKPNVLKMWDGDHDTFVAAAEKIDPDLVVFDPVFNAGLVAAGKLGVPAIGHNYMCKRYTPELVREHANRCFERHNAELPEKLEMIDIAPPVLLEDGPPSWQMRYIPYNGGGTVPDWLTEPPERGARICISLGTPLPHRSDPKRFTHLLDQVAEIKADFVLTVGKEMAEKLGELPDNVRVPGWVPLYELLRSCDAVIHHGGSGTLFSACAAGLPQLIVPQGADNDFNARRAERYGFAHVRQVGKVTRADIEALLSDDKQRERAHRIQTLMNSQATPVDMVGPIENFAA